MTEKNYQLSGPRIGLPHAVVRTACPSGDEEADIVERFGFLSGSGRLAICLAMSTGYEDGNYWWPDSLTHVASGYAIRKFHEADTLDDALDLMGRLDRIDGWDRERTEIEDDTDMHARVMSIVAEWRAQS